MFDDLREPDKENQTFQESLGFGTAGTAERVRTTQSRAARGFLGVTATQRLVLALLLLLAVCVLGTMCLLISGRISAF